MKVLIFNGFPFHYEMLGFALYYFNNKDVIPDVLCRIHDSWLDIYAKEYKFNLLNTANIESYDKIFLVTDDDYSISDSIILKYPDKFVAINHFYKNRRPALLYQIDIRPRSSGENYVYPIFPLISLEEKKIRLSDIFRKRIVYIGEGHPRDFGQIEKIKDWETYDLIFINRRFEDCVKNFQKTYSNIKILEKLPSTAMIEIIKNSHFVMVSDNDKYVNLWSGSIALSYAAGCKIIMHKKILDTLECMKTAVSFEDHIIIPEEYSLEDIFEERRIILENSKVVLDIYFA